MIIEDDEILNAGLCYNLQKRKIEPFSAGSIKEARRSLVGNTYDLILLDVNLPDGSGFEFAREIAARYDTPFIFLTAHNLDDEVIGGYRLGAEDYITKPFSINMVKKKKKGIMRRCAEGREKALY